MLGWMKHKLESRLLGEISITSDTTDDITLMAESGEPVETVTDFILGGFKITADGDCNHEIKTCSLKEKL